MLAPTRKLTGVSQARVYAGIAGVIAEGGERLEANMSSIVASDG